MHFQHISTNDSTECGCIRQCNLWSVPFICVYPITGAIQWFNSFGSHKCLNLLSARPLFTMAAGAGKEAGSMEAGTDDSRKVLPSLQDGEWATDMCDCCAEPGGLAGCGYGAAIPMCMYAENLKHQPKHSMCAASNECGSCVSFAATAFGGAVVAAVESAFGLAVPLLHPGWPLHLYARNKLRKRYGINGNCYVDCLSISVRRREMNEGIWDLFLFYISCLRTAGPKEQGVLASSWSFQAKGTVP